MALCGFGPVGFAPVGGAELSLPPVGFTETPADLFSGYAFDGTDLTIPLAALSPHGLTVALANATTGDPRSISYTLMARIEEWYTELDSDDRPAAFVAQPRTSIVSLHGSFAGKEKLVHRFTTYRERPEGTVVDEV